MSAGPRRSRRADQVAPSPPTRSEIVITNVARAPDVELASLRSWLRGVVAELAPSAASLAVRLVGDRSMQRLNRTYRGKDQTTDVLSFPGEATLEGEHLGDIVIAVPVARRQAVEHGHPLRVELETLLLHGVLHCLGYDHETDDGSMMRLERRLRRRLIAMPADA